MIENSFKLPQKQRLISIVALNIVSTMAQIGQIGLGATLFPIALEAKHVSADVIGLTSAALWFGMLMSLLLAGKLTRWLGYRNTVIAGLLMGALSFILVPQLSWQWWSLPAAVIGFGTGLRWIANETWLYRLAPEEARGRVVGIHETLISLATVIRPMLTGLIVTYTSSGSLFWQQLVVIAVLFIAIYKNNSYKNTTSLNQT